MNITVADTLARGYRYAHLDTLSFQAQPFYQKLGYHACGEKDTHTER